MFVCSSIYFSKPRSRSRFLICRAHTGYSFPSNCSIARPGATVIFLAVVVPLELPLSVDMLIFVCLYVRFSCEVGVKMSRLFRVLARAVFGRFGRFWLFYAFVFVTQFIAKES